MRKILFRGKAINRDERYETRTKYKNGDWVYGLVSKLGSEKYGIPMEMTNTDGISGIDVDRKTVGQYTGLNKNGKKIFEGDVVEYSEIDIDGSDIKGKGVLRWNDNTASFEISCGLFGVNFCQALLSQVEVIGNIYDNPELIGGKENG